MTTSSIRGADGLSARVTFGHLPHFGIFIFSRNGVKYGVRITPPGVDGHSAREIFG